MGKPSIISSGVMLEIYIERTNDYDRSWIAAKEWATVQLLIEWKKNQKNYEKLQAWFA